MGDDPQAGGVVPQLVGARRAAPRAAGHRGLGNAEGEEHGELVGVGEGLDLDPVVPGLGISVHQLVFEAGPRQVGDHLIGPQGTAPPEPNRQVPLAVAAVGLDHQGRAHAAPPRGIRDGQA